MSKKQISQSTNYITDSEKWICSCPYFLTNRFFLCKHLINIVKENISPQFFKEVQRQGVYPLLGMKPSFYSDDLNQPTILTDTITTAKTILNNRTGIVSKVFCKLQFI